MRKYIKMILLALLLIGISGGATMWAIDNMKDRIVAEANVKIKEAMKPSRIEVLQKNLEDNRSERKELAERQEFLRNEAEEIKAEIVEILGLD